MGEGFNLSEMFYSVQGEGDTAGTPAVFIRLGKCNLMCGGPKGLFVKKGKATWHCDTESVWRKFEHVTFSEMVRRLEEFGVIELIRTGFVPIIFTGGEPTYGPNADALDDFLPYLGVGEKGNLTRLEIETNGTIDPDPDGDWFGKFHTINCSPKLANSGMPENTRIVPAVLHKIRAHPRGFFKFVVSRDEDMVEIADRFIRGAGIPLDRVILMPGVSTLAELPERTRWVLEQGKKHGLRTCTRLQVLAWDEVTGV